MRDTATLIFSDFLPVHMIATRLVLLVSSDSLFKAGRSEVESHGAIDVHLLGTKEVRCLIGMHFFFSETAKL